MFCARKGLVSIAARSLCVVRLLRPASTCVPATYVASCVHVCVRIEYICGMVNIDLTARTRLISAIIVCVILAGSLFPLLYLYKSVHAALRVYSLFSVRSDVNCDML